MLEDDICNRLALELAYKKGVTRQVVRPNDLRQPEQARPFFEQALAILEETAVPEHPDFSLLRQRIAALSTK